MEQAKEKERKLAIERSNLREGREVRRRRFKGGTWSDVGLKE